MVYAGLVKMSCDMCGQLRKPRYTVVHKDGSKADICPVCYGKCLVHQKFNKGVETGEIKVLGG